MFLARETLKKQKANSQLLTKEEVSQLERKLRNIEAKIAEIHAESYFKTVKENLEFLVNDTENLNCIKMWQLKKKILNKTSEGPTAKKDENGVLVTSALQLKELYKTTYEWFCPAATKICRKR